MIRLSDLMVFLAIYLIESLRYFLSTFFFLFYFNYSYFSLYHPRFIGQEIIVNDSSDVSTQKILSLRDKSKFQSFHLNVMNWSELRSNREKLVAAKTDFPLSNIFTLSFTLRSHFHSHESSRLTIFPSHPRILSILARAWWNVVGENK